MIKLDLFYKVNPLLFIIILIRYSLLEKPLSSIFFQFQAKSLIQNRSDYRIIMSYQNTVHTTSTKSIYTKSQSHHKHRTQFQFEKVPFQNQKCNNNLTQTPPPNHNVSKSSTFSKQSIPENR